MLEIEKIHIESFDLSLSSMRIMNMARTLEVERSMRVHGQLQPVVARVYEGGVQLIDGFKRVYCAEVLCMDFLECRLLDVDEQQAKVLLMSYNRTNQSMEVWEEAMILKSLLEGGDMDQRKLSRLVGHSPSWVSRRLSLISKLDEEIAAGIKMGVLTSRHARALMRLPRGNQAEVARVISNYHLSCRLSDRLVDAYLEAEGEQEQRRLLEFPEEVLWYQWDLPEDPYDSRLSEYGNELMSVIMHMWRPLKTILSVLDDSRSSELGDSEKEIIYPFIGELKELTDKIRSITDK